MPDRYGENPEPEAPADARQRRLAAEMAITRCDLCDDDGYRGPTVCDHIDHTEAAKRGMAMIRATMGWK